eukprot:TRINITY_DN12293_c0_g1_i1.p1 TRINITY_DN12293_c0_g1~~TRINITY_DN12293_c0_g1_i1.p1  ORF type:complete len:229 (-),score=65.31 TRINITY_DN12293_c0_g1_i1:6-692(-)
MSERVIHQTRAAVYTYDGEWVPIGSGICNIYVYQGNQSPLTFRIVGLDGTSNDCLVNTSLSPSMNYTQVRDTFHQWADNSGTKGLSFSKAQDAKDMLDVMERSISKIGIPRDSLIMGNALSDESDVSEGKKKKYDEKKHKERNNEVTNDDDKKKIKKKKLKESNKPKKKKRGRDRPDSESDSIELNKPDVPMDMTSIITQRDLEQFKEDIFQMIDTKFEELRQTLIKE